MAYSCCYIFDTIKKEYRCSQLQPTVASIITRCTVILRCGWKALSFEIEKKKNSKGDFVFVKMGETVPTHIAELKSMFADVDKDVIEVIFESNQYNLEKTIDSLLKMSGDNVPNNSARSNVLFSSLVISGI